MKNPKSEIQIPKSFKFASVHAGLKPNNEKDLALIFSECPATIAGVFTKNRVFAAPVQICKDHLKNQIGQAIVINSKNANACTGDQGLINARRMTQIVAEKLAIDQESVFVCSTGVIGQQLPMTKIENGISIAVESLNENDLENSAHAIMTTDTVPKIVSIQKNICNKTITICGFAKGAGMIAPNMATMLAFITTDADIRADALQNALRRSIEKSFNRITVDSDTSTNDTVLILANGKAENPTITDLNAEFQNALDFVCVELAKMIARDGEGATKLIEVIIKNAKDQTDGERVARAIAESPLVKTAVFANDANWGRIMMAIGKSGAEIDQHNIDVWIGNYQVVKNGLGTNFDENLASDQMNREIVQLIVDLKIGSAEVTFWTCDYSFDYIKINAEYRT